MGPFEMVVAIVFIGCLTGIITSAIDKLSGSRRRASEQELRLARERAADLEQRLAELQRENDSLQKQLEWHSKLLEAQDQLVRQIGAGAAVERTAGARRLVERSG